MAIKGEQTRLDKITWSTVLYTVGSDIVPFLTVESCLNLDLSMTNREARPHLEKSYKVI